MLYYRCSHCGKRVPRGEKCGCNFKREYDAPQGTRRLYHTARWRKLQQAVLARHGWLDPYAMAEHKSIEHADTVHHIIPAEEEPGRFWDPDNLVPLSRSSHEEVHVLYRKDKDSKDATQAKLFSLVRHVEDAL